MDWSSERLDFSKEVEIGDYLIDMSEVESIVIEPCKIICTGHGCSVCDASETGGSKVIIQLKDGKSAKTILLKGEDAIEVKEHLFNDLMGF